MKAPQRTAMDIARNEPTLRKKTAQAPRAATINPPMAGPIARAMFMETPVNETAAGKSSAGTNSGVIACQAGILTAEPIPKHRQHLGKVARRLDQSDQQGESVSEVINQLSPTSCIHDPMLDTTLAIQSARKTD